GGEDGICTAGDCDDAFWTGPITDVDLRARLFTKSLYYFSLLADDTANLPNGHSINIDCIIVLPWRIWWCGGERRVLIRRVYASVVEVRLALVARQEDQVLLLLLPSNANTTARSRHSSSTTALPPPLQPHSPSPLFTYQT
ncbi:unnamed protein product, partial [Meganyctiphanes norvegica]